MRGYLGYQVIRKSGCGYQESGYQDCGDEKTNPKFEALNPKQIQILKIQKYKMRFFTSLGFVQNDPESNYGRVSIEGSVIDLHSPEALYVAAEAGEEIVVILRRLRRPADFSERRGAWISHVFEMLRVGDVFTP